MQSTLIERRQAELDSLTEELGALLERAAEDDRELTADEVRRSDELQSARTAKQTQIEHETEMSERRAKVQSRLAGIPTGPTITRAQPPQNEDDPDALAVRAESLILREAPTPGHYAQLLHQAWVMRDPDAKKRVDRIQELLRATAHQLTTDNPGVIPKPIVGPVVDAVRDMRPLVSSVATYPAPGPKFDRPVVKQHVLVGQQATEKTETASQKLLVDPVTITLMTQAGHLNISKQDIRWSQPSILGLVYESFAKIYARVSDRAACADFVAAVTQTQEIPGTPTGTTAADVDAALGAAGNTIDGSDGDEAELNHLWMARDIAVKYASMRNPTTGQKLYNIPLVNGTTGDMDGIPVTIDPRFAAGTFIAGDDSLVEFWEDLEGFLTVDEPSVLGQLVGYAGYSRLAVTVPSGFVKLTNLAVE